jgi:hypothetical protein
VDACNVHPSLMNYVPDKNVEQVCIVGNDETGGQRVVIMACYSYFSSKVVKQQSQRNPSTAIRVVHCLCHPSVRRAAAYWLGKKKIHDDLDQVPGLTEKSFGDLLLKLYKDPSLKIDRPAVMDLENHDPEHQIDPHQGDFERTPEWILGTWNEYISQSTRRSSPSGTS